KPKAKDIFDLVKESILGWWWSEAGLHAAALAYYTIFSLAPLLIISIAMATQLFSQAAVEGKIVTALQGNIGHEAAVVVQEIIKNSHTLSQSGFATIITALFLLYGASGMFRQLQHSLNTMWGIVPKAETIHQSLITMAKNYLLSAVAVLSVGLVVLGSLFINALWLAVPEQYLRTVLPNYDNLAPLVRFIASPLLFMMIIAVIFKALPRAKIRWRDVGPGAAVTALLFWIGSYLIGLYLSRSTWTSIFGAASSLIALLVWVYYSAWILLLGAKFTQVYTNKYGVPIAPRKDARFAAISH
ncbi:MAG TPA: YihY/virulence factor BrkB family protein, partial [Anaerolineae bacterium]|nr:YihY/virulence factor BrkB family protein [Anaerolineae bacterium]